MSDLQLLYHGNCFDGLLSAAIFTRFYRERVRPEGEIVYRAMAHVRGDPYGPNHDATFQGEDNAVVDFRYSPSPRLTWWCDHHESAFMRPEHQHHFLAQPKRQHCFDPRAPSCAGLLARWLARDHAFDASFFHEHVRWADLIDSARFDSPEQAVALAEPALQIMALLEAGPPAALVDEMIRGLSGASIEAVHERAEIQRALVPVLERHRGAIELFRRRLELHAGVAFFDLSEDAVEGFNKFIPYYLEPSARYTVGLTRSTQRVKVSAGSNPWRRPEPLVNLAALCGRYGGGGHAVVAAISLPPDALEEGRRAAKEIAAELGTGS